MTPVAPFLRLTVDLADRRAGDSGLTGGKAAGIARLIHAGFRVPAGFVIPADAMSQLGTIAGIQESGHGATASDLEELRRRILTTPIPDRLARAIARRAARLGGALAVRSSMVGEDSRTSSYAGQLDSFLAVDGEQALLESVRKCYASFCNPRRLSYAVERQARSLEAPKVAVIVQRMVASRVAGVAFSADPTTGAHNVVIEAATGFGTAVVDGRVEPDRYVVDERGMLAEARPSKAAPLMTRNLVLELARVVRAVASQAGAPRDVEWAWDGNDFHLLQARPITTLAGKHTYSSRLVADMSPGLIKPLVWSTKTVNKTENVFRPMFEQLIGKTDVNFRAIVRLFCSRLYADMTLMGELLSRAGLPVNMLEMMTRDEQSQRARLRPSLRLLLTMARLAGLVWRTARVAPEIRRYIEAQDRALEPLRRADWTGLNESELICRVDELVSLHGRSQWYVFVGPLNMAVRYRLIDRLIRRKVEGMKASELLRGSSGLKALEPNRELVAMARLVPPLGSEVHRALAGEDDREIRVLLGQTVAGRTLLERFDGFLSQFGFLSANGSDFTEVPWVDDPRLLWRALARLAGHPVEPGSVELARAHREALARVRGRLRFPRRQVFEGLLRATIQHIDLRERTSLLMSEESYLMRRAFLAIGARLQTRGVVADPEDVFYLFLEELRTAVSGGLEPAAIARLIAERRAGLAADALVEPPDTITGEVPPSVTAPDACPDRDFLVGIGGSAGRAEGFARIVTDPSQAPAELGPHDILIVPFTDVGWTPLLPGIGGLVAETGGQLSHTSIIAREYGIPAVVSVRRAMRLIRDGQALTVDGSAGRVYLKQPKLEEEAN